MIKIISFLLTPLLLGSFLLNSVIKNPEPTILEKETKVDYYYFCADYCGACKEQTKIIKKLNSQGYDFKIKKNEFKKYNITTLPTILVIIKEKGKEIVTVKMENHFWSKRDLKILVTTVNYLT